MYLFFLTSKFGKYIVDMQTDSYRMILRILSHQFLVNIIKLSKYFPLSEMYLQSNTN